MAVAAADFYSYAKATGTPLPKSKQEEAQLAPAVNNWKKARLKAPERERDSGDLGNVLGGGAIAAGLAGAALYGYRRGWGDSPAPRKPAPTGDLPSEIPTRVYTDEQRPVDLKGTRNKKTGTYQASVYGIQKEQPQAGTQVRDIAGEEALWNANYWANFHAIKRANPSWNIADIDKQAVLAAKQATNQPIRKGYVPGPATDNRISLQEIPESSPVDFSPRNYVESTGAVEPTNVELPQITGTEPKGLLSQDFVQRALDQTKPSYAQEFTKDELDALRGIRFAVKDIQNEGKPKFYENRGIDLERISNAPKIKTGTFLDNAIGNLPATVIAADEVARRGVKDIGDAARGIKKVVVENAPSNLPDLSRVPKAGINTSPTVQLSDGSAVGPLYPFKQFVRGLTGDESVDIVEPDTLVAQQKTIASELADQSLESANSGYQQMADPIERSVQRDTDSVAIGNKAAQVEALQQELLVGQRSNLGPKPVTTQTRQDKFYTSPRRLSPEAKQYTRTGDIGSFTGEAFGGSRLAGTTNVPVQRGTPAGGQLQLPIVYSTQDKINPALRTQLVNEGPTYTSVDEYLARFEPVKEEIIESPLEKDLIEARAMAELSQREGELLERGLRPVTKGGQPTIRFDNARAAGWTSKQYTPISITSDRFQENVSMPKTLREALGQESGRVFYELDEQGEIIPETVQIRGERPEVMRYPKSGGGRKVAEVPGPNPNNELDRLIREAQQGTGAGLLDSRKMRGRQTRYVTETIEPEKQSYGYRITDTEGLETSPRIYTDGVGDAVSGRTIGPYGIENQNKPAKEWTNQSQAITSIAPSASPGSWTPAKGTAGNENVNIVISGSRDYTNYPEFVQKTDQIIREMNIPANKKITIVEGGAKGADKLAERYARERGYGLVVKPADWSKGGTLKYPQSDKSAGPRRNREMAKMGDVGIAFPGGKGTSNFVKTMAREEGKPVYYASEITEATSEGKRAMEASEEIRKIYSSGRPDAQQQVQAYIQGLRKGQQF